MALDVKLTIVDVREVEHAFTMMKHGPESTGLLYIPRRSISPGSLASISYPHGTPNSRCY
jgi:hypothetical protein